MASLDLGLIGEMEPIRETSVIYAHFRLPASTEHQAVQGDVVAVPLTPQDLLVDQDRAVRLMHRAVKVAERTGPAVDVVGLGSLCAVVGGRGTALQERLNVPVTTGGAATVWTMFSNAIQVQSASRTDGGIGVRISCWEDVDSTFEFTKGTIDRRFEEVDSRFDGRSSSTGWAGLSLGRRNGSLGVDQRD